MFDGIRNWFEVRAAMKDARRLRAGQMTLNSVLVSDKLRHADEMAGAGQLEYAAATLDEVLQRWPEEAAELPGTIHVMFKLKRLDDAEALALRGTRRNPDHREFAFLYAQVADHRNDIPERLRRWSDLRRRYPAWGPVFVHEAQALTLAGDAAAAEQLLSDGVRAAPDEIGIALEFARCAEAREDWPEARRRWVYVRDRFEFGPSAVPAAMTLVKQGLYDQAVPDLLDARRRYPSEWQATEELAFIAERRGDLDGALVYWTEFRRSFPNFPNGYTHAARLLRARGEDAAADALIVEAAARAPDNQQLQHEYAAIAERTGDWGEASRRWMLVRQRFRTDSTAHVREAAALRQLGLIDDAERLMLAALEYLPNAADIWQQLAEIAEARGDRQLSAERWRMVVQSVPGVWWTHAALATALERSGDTAGADQVLAAAIARLPDEPVLYADYAALAGRDGRATEAASRWAAARARFGALPMLARRQADWLRDQGRPEEALAVLEAACRQAPEDADLPQALAEAAMLQGDFARAEAGWRAVLALRPNLAQAVTQLAEALRRQDRAAEAEATLSQATAAQPQDFGLADAWARDAAERRDWAEAHRRWRVVAERFPAEGHACWQAAIALREAGRTEDADAQLLAGAERFPADANFPRDLARRAEARRDQPAAERWWRRYTDLSPGDWWGWVGLLSAIRQQGRAGDLDALVASLEPRFGATPTLLQLQADWAREQGDWAEVARLGDLMLARFPDAWQGLHYLGVALRAQGRLDDARAALERGRQRFPSASGFVLVLAEMADHRGDWAAAEPLWREMVALHPDVSWPRYGLARALRGCLRAPEADAVLAEAEPEFAHDPGFHVEYAASAVQDARDDVAEQRYAAAYDRFGPLPALALPLARWLRTRDRLAEAADLLAAAMQRHPAESDSLARDWREATAALALQQADPPVTDPDILLGPAGDAPAIPRRPVYTWYINGWMLPRSLPEAVGTTCLTTACPDAFDAVRVGYANVLETPWTIRRLVVCASAAYGDHITPVDDAGAPLPDGAWRTVTFAGGGADRAEIVTDPAAPAAIVVAPTTIEGAHGEPGGPSWTWTDWVPCTSLGPDPETGMHVLMLRALIPGGQTITYPNGAFEGYRLERAVNQGFECVPFGLWGDRVTQPSLPLPAGRTIHDWLGSNLVNGSLFHAIQFRTRRPVVQGMVAGDSHQAGPFLLHATTRLGQPGFGRVPFGYANAAVGGLRSDQFFPRLQALLDAVAPSCVLLPGWTFNDHYGASRPAAEIDRAFFERLHRAAEEIRQTGALPIWLTPFPRNPADMSPDRIASWHWLREQILRLREAGEIVVDAGLLFSYSVDGRPSGFYWPHFTTDESHPSEPAHHVLGDLLVELFRRLVPADGPAPGPSAPPR